MPPLVHFVSLMNHLHIYHVFPVGNLRPLTLRWGCNLNGPSYIYIQTTSWLSKQLAQSFLRHTTPAQAHYPTPVTPISLVNWEPYLISHPDQRFAGFIRRGFTQGFRVGITHPQSRLKHTRRNHPSAHSNPKVVSDHIESEASAGRI